MSAKPLVLAACCSGLFAPALALDLPSGWTSREENNLTHYQPQDIGDRVFILSALTPLPDGGKRSADWLTAVAPQFAGQYGKVLEHGTAEQAGDLANMTYRVEVQGKPLHINFTAFPAGDGKMRLVQLLSEEDAALLQSVIRTMRRPSSPGCMWKARAVVPRPPRSASPPLIPPPPVAVAPPP